MTQEIKDQKGDIYAFPDDATDEEIKKFFQKLTLVDENAKAQDRSLTLTAPTAPTDTGGGMAIPPPTGAEQPTESKWFPQGMSGMSELLPAAGGAVGGTLGALTANPAIAIGGAGVGSAMGEAVRRYIAGESADPSAVVGSGLLGAATEGGGQALYAGVRKAAAPYVKGFADKASEQFRALAAREGIPTSPAEEVGSKSLAQIESFPFRVPFGSSKMVEAKTAELDAMEAAARRFAYPENAIPAESVRGRAAQEMYSKAEDLARGKAGRFYNDVKQLAGDTPIPTPRYVEAVKKAVDRIEGMGGLAPSSEARFARTGQNMLDASGAVDPARERVVKAIAGQLGADANDPLVQSMATQALGPAQGGQQGITYQAAHTTQSLLSSAIRSSNNDFAKGRLSELRDALLADIGDWAKTQNPKLQEAMTRATTYYRQEIGGVFDEKSFIRQMLKADPAEVVGMVRTVGDARKLRQAIDNFPAGGRADALLDMRRDFMQGVIDKSLDPKTQVFSPDRFITQLSKYTDEAKRAVLGRQEADHLEEVASVLRRGLAYSKAGLNPSETGRAILGAEQLYGMVRFGAGAGIAGVTAGAAGGTPAGLLTAGTVLVTPAMLSRLLTSETGRAWLTRGLSIPPGTQEAMRAAEQIAVHGLAQRVKRDDGDRRLLVNPDAVLTGRSDLRSR